jgi:hypothetical protein
MRASIPDMEKVSAIKYDTMGERTIIMMSKLSIARL